MSDLPLTSLFDLLIQRAERVMMRGAFDRELETELAKLNDDIETAVRRPVEGVRLIFDEEKLLARCLLRIIYARRAREDDRALLWMQIAGVLFPVAQKHFGEALDAHRRARPDTTNQDYAPKR